MTSSSFHTRSRRVLVLKSNFLAIMLVLGSAAMSCGPLNAARTNLWDVTNGSMVVTDDSGTSQFYVPHDTGIRNMFTPRVLPTAITVEEERRLTLFADNKPAGFVHFVEWQTASSITLGSFSLYAPDDTIRRFDRFTLYGWNSANGAFQPIFDAVPTKPYTSVDGSIFLLYEQNISPITTNRFRAEFVQTDAKTNAYLGYTTYGPRVVLLSGYAPGQYTLNTGPVINGTITGIAGGGKYLGGTVATLTATPAPGYMFTGWTGDAAGTTNPLSVVMDSDKTIGANFAPGTSNVDANFNPNISGRIWCIAPQYDGKLLVGGGMGSVGGSPCSDFVRLNPDGTLDNSFGPTFNDEVVCIVIQPDGKIVVGGSFTSIGGTTRNHLARLNADGSLDGSFDPNVNGPVGCLGFQADGRILIGGAFTQVGGTTRNRLARINADGSLDTGFNPNVNSEVYCLALQPDGKILVGGWFSKIGSSSCSYLARLTAGGTVDSGFSVTPNNAVWSLAVQADGKILAGGIFTSIGSTTRNQVARLNAAGSLDSGFNPNLNGLIRSIGLQADGKILLGGGFTSVGGVTRNYAARLNTDGTLESGFNPNPGSEILCMTLPPDGNLLLGGYFNIVGTTPRNSIARISNDTTAIQTLGFPSASEILWSRSGSSPEVDQVSFESFAGNVWTLLGSGSRVAGGWHLSGVNLTSSSQIRVRGRTTCGVMNGSSWLVEQIHAVAKTLAASTCQNGGVTGFGSYDYASVATLTATPTPGYVFAGWIGDATGTDNPLSVLMDRNKTIGAIFALKSSAKDILAFAFPGLPPPFIAANTVSVTVPYGTVVTNLAPVFTVSPLASGTPASGAAMDFTSPQTYTVTAQDGTTKTYTVTVTRQSAIESWRQTSFGSATSNTSDSEDFDHDGVTNLNEFAFGMNPTVPGNGQLQYTGNFAGGTISATGQPKMAFESTPSGVDLRTLFVRRKDYAAAGLTYTVQFSADLATWKTSAAVPTVLADDGTCQIVSVPYPPFVNGRKARFFRVGVSITP